MARARDHRATYARRNELARERGFRNYADQRKEVRIAGKSTAWRGAKPNVRDAGDIEKVHQWWATFADSEDNYMVGGPKYEWFVNTVESMTHEEWLEHYPNGTRFDT